MSGLLSHPLGLQPPVPYPLHPPPPAIKTPPGMESEPWETWLKAERPELSSWKDREPRSWEASVGGDLGSPVQGGGVIESPALVAGETEVQDGREDFTAKGFFFFLVCFTKASFPEFLLSV